MMLSDNRSTGTESRTSTIRADDSFNPSAQGSGKAQVLFRQPARCQPQRSVPRQRMDRPVDKHGTEITTQRIGAQQMERTWWLQLLTCGIPSIGL